MSEALQRHSLLVGLGKQALSFAAGIIVAAFILGRNSQKINDVVQWKSQIAPIIERMDRSGTVSFEHFHKEYEKTQSRQEKQIDELQKEVNAIGKKVDP